MGDPRSRKRRRLAGAMLAVAGATSAAWGAGGDAGAPADDRTWISLLGQPRKGGSVYAPERTAATGSHEFRPRGKTWRVKHFSPQLDGLAFKNKSERCYGHSLMAIRWFQFLVKPLKDGVWDRVTPEELRDFFGGHLAAVPEYDITPANVDDERLARYTTVRRGPDGNRENRAAIARLIENYHSEQDNGDEAHRDVTYRDAPSLRQAVADFILTHGIPGAFGLFEGGFRGEAHAVVVYSVVEGIATLGARKNPEGRGFLGGTRLKAYKVNIWDPNIPSNGKPERDKAYEDGNYLMFFEQGKYEYIAFGASTEMMYTKYLRTLGGDKDHVGVISADRVKFAPGLYDDANEVSEGDYAAVSDSQVERIVKLK